MASDNGLRSLVQHYEMLQFCCSTNQLPDWTKKTSGLSMTPYGN